MPSSIIEAHTIKDPSSSTTVVEVMKKKVSASLGYGYHEFVKSEFISPNTKVVLEDKVLYRLIICNVNVICLVAPA